MGKVNKAVNAFLGSDKGKTMLEQNSLQGVGGSPEELKAFIDSERARWGPVIEAARQFLDVRRLRRSVDVTEEERWKN